MVTLKNFMVTVYNMILRQMPLLFCISVTYSAIKK